MPQSTYCVQIFIFIPGEPWLITIWWSKTIQFRERVVHVPLPAVPDSPLCLVTAVKRALHFTGQSPTTSQAFAFLSSPDFTPKPLTYPMFLCKLRCILELLGLPAKDYAAHSFRSGGASFAFQARVLIEQIKMLGDWHSNSVLLYLTVPLHITLQSVNVIANINPFYIPLTISHQQCLGLECN